ncbi:MAG: alpha-L-glutamate ligase-like protein [Thermoguttaceae bacterium]|jgi:alpha-L-glutamate ligase-like protein
MRRFWLWPSELRRSGILGINRRNGEYVLPLNPRPYYPRVDEKHQTKLLCHRCRIPVPETYAMIRRHGDVPKFLELIGRREEFVIKPGAGSGGRGILVVARHDGAEFFTAGGERFTLADVTYHLGAVLSGLYSLAGQPDCAIIEQRLLPHPIFADVAVEGTPDVRVVLYRSVPVMAMVRLPTKASRGRANLHQGAAGAGIHLVTGRTFGGVCNDRAIAAHPDTRRSIAGLEIPGWNDLLSAAMELADAVELGYVGVDFVLDAQRGPVVLEANARPGLNIQVANRRGLLPRLRFLDAQPPGRLRPDERRALIAELAEM